MSHAISAAKEFAKLSLGGEEKDPLTNLLAAIPRLEVDRLTIPTRSYTTAARKLCVNEE
jgi:hypothetical protein